MCVLVAIVEIYRAHDLTDLICVRSFLESRGICAFVRNEQHITQSGGVLALALGGYQLHVVEPQAREALIALGGAQNGEFALADDFDENRTWFA
ncbi:MAG: hypothetical protein KDD85_11520 [Parvularculaceae bacterium]|nr:hypothetical protein [Parvularculaceae bacterium]